MSFFDEIVAQLGRPYVYGAEGPSTFDCSGLVVYAAQKVGLTVPRVADAQMHALPSTDSPSVGDLVFFGNGGYASHVGVCANNGCSIMIDAPHTGAVVRQDNIPAAGGGWGTEQVLGYRSIPGAGSGGISGGGLGPGGFADSLTSGVNGDITQGGGFGLNPITDIENLAKAISNIPSDIFSYLTNGKGMGEVVFRGIEVLVGGLLMSAGLVMFVKVLGDTAPGKVASSTRANAQSFSGSIRSGAGAVHSAGSRVNDRRISKGLDSTEAEYQAQGIDTGPPSKEQNAKARKAFRGESYYTRPTKQERSGRLYGGKTNKTTYKGKPRVKLDDGEYF